MSDGKLDEMSAIEWRAFLEDNLDTLLEGVPKSPPGWWDLQPGEDAIAYMFRVFPLARTH
jgi:hypothetical protein